MLTWASGHLVQMSHQASHGQRMESGNPIGGSVCSAKLNSEFATERGDANMGLAFLCRKRQCPHVPGSVTTQATPRLPSRQGREPDRKPMPMQNLMEDVVPSQAKYSIIALVRWHEGIRSPAVHESGA